MSSLTTGTARRRTMATAALLALAAIATACPVESPTPSPYHPERLAPGNRIIINGPGSAGVTAANPGGVVPFPADPVAADDLRYDSLSYGNPGIGIPAEDDRVATVEHPTGNTLGLFDGDGNLRLDFGALVGVRFSDDGTLLAISRIVAPRSIDVYDTADLTLLRSIPWSGTWPMVHDISADNSTMLVRGMDVGASSTDYTLYAYATTGSNDPQVVLPETGGSHLDTHVAKTLIRFTDAGRVVYVADPAGHGPLDLRSVALDGTDDRRLGDGTTISQVTGEWGTGRVLVQQAVPGSTTLTQVVAIEDAVGGASTVIASPLTDQSFSRVILPA